MEEKKIEKRKKRRRHPRLKKYIWVVYAILVLVLIVGIYIFQNLQYDYVKTVKVYDNESTNDGNYVVYAEGILEYNKDGIAFLSEIGEEIWNHPCQMRNPISEICGETAIVADKGGTNIYVFQKNGLKGEIQTTRPIERVAVSGQGVVATILQDEETPRVMCYDAKGNVLIEHKASFKNTGYPIDLAISQDGKTLMVSYLCTKGSGVVTKLSYYYFGEDAKNQENYQVMKKEYKDAVGAKAMFLDSKTSALVLDNTLIFYEGLNSPKETYAVKLDKEIKSVAYDEKNVVLVLKNSGETGYELRMYQTNGKQKMSVQFDGEFESVKVYDGQVLLSEGSKCTIYNAKGVCKFEGSLDVNIMEVYPTSGLNKYMVISANGFQEIQLAK